MVRITNTIDIAAPAHEVYAALRAMGGYRGWLGHSMVYRGTAIAGPVADASARYEDSTMLGRMRGELVEDVPDRALRFHQRTPSGGLDASIQYSFDGTGGSTGTATHVTRVGELTTHGMLRAVQPMLVRMAAAESARTMKALKSHVEHP